MKLDPDDDRDDVARFCERQRHEKFGGRAELIAVRSATEGRADFVMSFAKYDTWS